MLPALLLFLTFATFTTLTYLWVAPSDDRAAILRRMQEIRRPVVIDRNEAVDAELARPMRERVLLPLLGRLQEYLLRLTPGRAKERMQQHLDKAGRPVELAYFAMMKAIGAVIGVGAGGVLGFVGQGSNPALMPVVLGVLGAYLPDFWVSRQGSRRLRLLSSALPDVLDLLSVSVEAGLGFDGAVAKVAEKFPDPTSSEFQAYLREMRLGKTREEALRGLAERSRLPELQTFVAAVIQAEQLGAPMVRVLRAQADAMRERRKQRAEERAMKAPVKLLFPLVTFIFPTLFIVLLGPAVIRVMETFGK